MLERIFQLYKSSFSGLSKEIWLLSFITLINRAGTMVLPFLSVYLTKELDFSFTQASYILSCAGLGGVAGTWIGGKLTDSIGYFKTMFWSLLSVGFLFLVLLFAKTFMSLAIGIFFTNLVGDIFRPASLTAIYAYSKPENNTRSVSLIRLAINLGFAAGPFIAGVLAFYAGYHWLFILDGITCITAAFLLLFLLSEKKVDNQMEKDEILKEGKLSSPLEDKPYLIFLVGMFFTSLAFMQLFYTLPVFLKEDYLMTEDMIGALLSMNGLLIAIFEMPIIFLIEHKYAKLKLIAIAILMMAASFLIFNITPLWIGIPIISMIIITFAEIIDFPFANTWAIERSNILNRGAYMAYFTMSFSVGTIFAPILGLQVAEHLGFATLWYISTILCLIAFSLFYYLHKREAHVLQVS